MPKEQVKEGVEKIDKKGFFSNKKFRKNFIQFIIGLILLSFSFAYLQHNPAERISVVSGVEIIFQRIQIFFTGIFTGKSSILEDKYSMEKRFKEVLYVLEKGDCATDEKMAQLKQHYSDLQHLNLDAYYDARYDYYERFNEYYSLATQKCTEK